MLQAWVKWLLRAVASIGGLLSGSGALAVVKPHVAGIAGLVGAAAGILAASPLPGQAPPAPPAPPAGP